MSATSLLIIMLCGAIGFGIVFNVLSSDKLGKSHPSKTNEPHGGAKRTGRKAGTNAAADPPWQRPTPLLWNQVLGVGMSAGRDDIRVAYRSLIQQYHPDKFATAAPEIQVYAAEKTQSINLAYQTAKDAGRA